MGLGVSQQLEDTSVDGFRGLAAAIFGNHQRETESHKYEKLAHYAE
jgi:hypothetical protein